MATHHLWTARHAARLCAEREMNILQEIAVDVEHRSHALTAVISAAAFLETIVNEVFQDVADINTPDPRIDGIPSDGATKLRAFWKGSDTIEQSSALQKYQIALACVGRPLLADDQPYQDARMVIRLRNALIHFKPQWQAEDVEHELERKLKGKFVENQQPVDARFWYPNKALGAGCAEWACVACTKLVAEWWNRMGLVRQYDANLHQWPTP